MRCNRYGSSKQQLTDNIYVFSLDERRLSNYNSCYYHYMYKLRTSLSSTNRNTEQALVQAKIPLYRLPRDICDKPVTSPLAQIPLHQLPRKRGSFAEVGVMKFGLKGTSRVRHGRHGEVSIVEFGLRSTTAMSHTIHRHTDYIPHGFTAYTGQETCHTL